MMLRYLLREPRKLHRGDLMAWLTVLAIAGILFALCGCETPAPCDKYLASKTMPQAYGCHP
jgi:hypothetical protein